MAKPRNSASDRLYWARGIITRKASNRGFGFIGLLEGDKPVKYDLDVCKDGSTGDIVNVSVGVKLGRKDKYYARFVQIVRRFRDYDNADNSSDGTNYEVRCARLERQNAHYRSQLNNLKRLVEDLSDQIAEYQGACVCMDKYYIFAYYTYI